MRPTLRTHRPGWAVALLVAVWGCTVEVEPESSARVSDRPVRPAHLWPPRVGELYPDLELRTPSGERVALSSFRGKVVLIEPIGMDCPACNAFSGANRPGVGGFEGTRPQRGLPSLHEMLDGAGVARDDERLVIVQILFYGMRRKAPPSLALARRWAQHFDMGSGRNEVVLVADDYLIGPATFKMIPGFQLVDPEFRLRWDATGHRPRHDLWGELLPALPRLLAQVDLPAGPDV